MKLGFLGRFAGSIFVNSKARVLLQSEFSKVFYMYLLIYIGYKDKLRGSQYDNPVILDEFISEAFENSTKRQFSNASNTAWLKIGNRSENNVSLGIRSGALRIDGWNIIFTSNCYKDLPFPFLARSS